MNQLIKIIPPILFCLLALTNKAISQVNNNELPIWLDKDIKVGRLENGFTYYLKNDNAKVTAISFVVKVGFNQENVDQKGFAHLLEHMPMSGTENFNNAKNYFGEYGLTGSKFNASTTDNLTEYHTILSHDKMSLFDQILKFYRDCAHGIDLSAEHIDAERLVVQEEGRRGIQNSSDILIRKGLMGNTKYKKMFEMNELDNIKKFKGNSLKKFYNKWYRSNFQALAIVGSINVDETEELIKSLFSNLVPSKEKIEDFNVTDTSFFKWKNEFSVINSDENSEPKIKIYIKRPYKVMKTHKDLEFLIYTKLYNLMIKERFSSYTDRGAASYSIASSQYIQDLSVSGPGFDVINTSFSFEGRLAYKALREILDEHERIKRFGFLDIELSTAKNAVMFDKELFGNVDSESLVSRLIDHFATGKAVLDPGIHREMIMNLIDNISVDRFNEAIKQWFGVNNNLNIFLIAPKSTADTILSATHVWKMVNETRHRNLNRYEIQAPKTYDKNLIEKDDVKKLLGGGMKFSKRDTDLTSGVSKVTLANGIEIFFKVLEKSAETHDRVMLRSIYGNRHDVIPIERFELNGFVPSVISNSGLGPYDQSGLNKYFAKNKVDHVSPYYIPGIGVGISASFDEDAIETVLQAIYLYMTSPKVDSLVLIKRVSNEIKKLKSGRTTKEIFSDTIEHMGTRSRISSTQVIKELEELDRNFILSRFKDVFSSTNDVKFFFAGSFDLMKFIYYTQRYLGNIQPHKNVNFKSMTEKSDSLGNLPHNVQIRGAENDLSLVHLCLNGTFQFSLIEKVKLDIIKKYLDNQIDYRLRFKEKGIYSVNVNLIIRRSEPSKYTFDVDFGCGEENINRLVASVRDEIEKVRSIPISPDSFSAIKNSLKEDINRKLLHPDFWVKYMTEQQQCGLPFNEILAEINLIDTINSEDITRFASKHIISDQIVVFNLVP